jgi:hypothetical protein
MKNPFKHILKKKINIDETMEEQHISSDEEETQDVGTSQSKGSSRAASRIGQLALEKDAGDIDSISQESIGSADSLSSKKRKFEGLWFYYFYNR